VPPSGVQFASGNSFDQDTRNQCNIYAMNLRDGTLDTSVGMPGPHGFAVRKRLHSSRKLPTSTATCPTFDTFAKRPSHRVTMATILEQFAISEKPNIFINGG